MKINRPLAISILLNLGLLGLIGSMLAGKTKSHPTQASGDSGEFYRETAPPSAAAPFHWSQVESADYATYVANLRVIGCPEKTVRNIVTTELAEVFVRERNELPTQSTTAGVSSPVPAITQKLQDLEREQQDFLASLLSPPATNHGERVLETAVLPSVRDSLVQSTNDRTAGPVGVHLPATAATDAVSHSESQNSSAAKASEQNQRSKAIASQPANILPVDAPAQRPARRDLFTVEEQRYRALWGWGGFYYEPATGQ